MTYMYSWYTLFRGDQGQFSDWNGQQRHAWIVTCRRGFELSELCFLWVQDWIQVHLISFFGVFCNFKTNHIFTILQLKVKMMWSLVEFLSMRTFYDTCYTKNECRWQSALNIISQDIRSVKTFSTCSWDHFVNCSCKGNFEKDWKLLWLFLFMNPSTPRSNL